MKLILNVLLVMGAAVLLALLVVAMQRGSPAPVPPGAVPARTAAGTTAGFYLNLDTREKLEELQARLARLTTGAPDALGAIKDDMALLADEPAAIQAVLEAFAVRWRLTRFEGNAFGDIFIRVKNRRFVEPVISMFASGFPQVQNKAVRAAATQKDPRFLPYLDRIYDKALAGGAEHGSGVRERVLIAAEACGGDLLPGIVAKALVDPALTVRSFAAELAGRLGLMRCVPLLQTCLQSQDPHLHYEAAVALACLDAPPGLEELVNLLDPKSPRMAQDAAFAVREHRLAGAASALSSLLDEAPVEVWTAFLGTLTVLGDQSAMEQAFVNIEAQSPLRRLGALTALAASGQPRYRKVLREAAVREGERVYRGISLGLTWALHPDLELVKTMIKLSIQPRAMIEVAMHIGDPLVPWLEKELQGAHQEGRIMGLVVMLARMATPAARRALLRSLPVHRRLVEEGLRQLDLLCRRTGRHP